MRRWQGSSLNSAMRLANPSDPDPRHFPDWHSKMGYDQLLASYTTIPAWQMHMKGKIGSIEVGKYAGMAIFEKSLRDIAADKLLKQAKVVGTLLGGEFTH